MSLEDVVPTIMAAVGVPEVKEQLLEGYQAGDKRFRVHLDGYDQLPCVSGDVDESPRTSSPTAASASRMRIREQQLQGPLPDQGRLVRAGQTVRPTMPNR